MRILMEKADTTVCLPIRRDKRVWIRFFMITVYQDWLDNDRNSVNL